MERFSVDIHSQPNREYNRGKSDPARTVLIHSSGNNSLLLSETDDTIFDAIFITLNIQNLFQSSVVYDLDT
jgi:hypothetical protein